MQHLHLLPSIQETHTLIERYRDIHQQITTLEKDKKAIAEQLNSGHFAANKDFILNGRMLMQKIEITQSRLDGKRLEEENPAIHAQYQMSITFSQLRLK